jgi:N-methylhydantoinase B
LLVNPQRPVDGGTFKTLTVKAPEGSIFRAQEPAACQWYFTPLGLLIDLIPRALAEALPDAVAGAHYGDSMVIYVAGQDPRRRNAPFLSVEPTPGGWGAFATGDGQDGLINNVNGAFKDLPVEIYENRYPVMIRDYGFRPDTGGPGRFRGGCGVYRDYHLEAASSLYLWFDRSVTPAWGLDNGRDAVGPDCIVNPGTESERHLLKVNALALEAGSVVRLQTGGGGGFGHPFDRDPRSVAADVLDGYVTADGAKRDYGVVVTPDGLVNEDATSQLRETARART